MQRTAPTRGQLARHHSNKITVAATAAASTDADPMRRARARAMGRIPQKQQQQPQQQQLQDEDAHRLGVTLPPIGKRTLREQSKASPTAISEEDDAPLVDEDDEEEEDEVAEPRDGPRAPSAPLVRLRGVGHATTEGSTGHANEDRYVVAQTARFHLFAVLDGHGGSRAADYVVSALVRSLDTAFARFDRSRSMEGDADEVDGKLKREVIVAVEQLDATFLATARRTHDFSGACLLGVLLYWNAAAATHRKLVFNCGDCRAIAREAHETQELPRRAVCGGKGNAKHHKHGKQHKESDGSAALVALSDDHCVNNRKEKLRALEAGAFIQNGRIAGVLEPFRSVGDLDMKGRGMVGWVIPTPEVRVTELQVGHTTLVLATDGVWSVLSNQRVMAIAQQELVHGGDAQSAADAIADDARARGSEDDITVIVVVV